MKVLIVNPIIYTSETASIKRAESIKDTMIYDLCLAFAKKGISVTLAAAEDYRPEKAEDYPFEVIWLESKIKKLCRPNVIPFCPQIKRIAKIGEYDLIISSEVFSLNTLMLALHCRKKLVIWHELAKHNRIMKGIPSRIWYSVVARLFMSRVPIVPRSLEARNFISNYCRNTLNIIIDHGVNLEKFTPERNKENQFAISSQLIPRKRIHLAIAAFADYLKRFDNSASLYIMGEGEEKDALMAEVKRLGIESNVVFTGKLAHNQLIEYLKKSIAMLVYTERDNNMVSIVEAIALGTPVITTSVPYNASYIRENRLGIVCDNWGAEELYELKSNDDYIKACLDYRNTLSTESKVEQFLSING